MKKIIFIFLLLLSLSLIAQDYTNLVKYTNAIEKADSCINMGNYQQAQKYYNAAEVYCRDSSENIKNAKDALFKTINQLRVQSDSLLNKIKIEQRIFIRQSIQYILLLFSERSKT